jgi:hypothetical protein
MGTNQSKSDPPPPYTEKHGITVNQEIDPENYNSLTKLYTNFEVTSFPKKMLNDKKFMNYYIEEVVNHFTNLEEYLNYIIAFGWNSKMETKKVNTVFFDSVFNLHIPCAIISIANSRDELHISLKNKGIRSFNIMITQSKDIVNKKFDVYISENINELFGRKYFSRIDARRYRYTQAFSFNLFMVSCIQTNFNLAKILIENGSNINDIGSCGLTGPMLLIIFYNDRYIDENVIKILQLCAGKINISLKTTEDFNVKYNKFANNIVIPKDSSIFDILRIVAPASPEEHEKPDKIIYKISELLLNQNS